MILLFIKYYHINLISIKDYNSYVQKRMLNVSVVRIDVLCLEKIPIKSNRKGKAKHKKAVPYNK